MHLTLKKEATKPASFNFLQQQERFDRFAEVYNQERPHQALGGAYPGDLYTPSARVYTPPPEPEYPFHDKAVRVTHCGRICLGRRKINLSRALAGQIVGIREIASRIFRTFKSEAALLLAYIGGGPTHTEPERRTAWTLEIRR
jgi:putative transposase